MHEEICQTFVSIFDLKMKENIVVLIKNLTSKHDNNSFFFFSNHELEFIKRSECFIEFLVEQSVFLFLSFFFFFQMILSKVHCKWLILVLLARDNEIFWELHQFASSTSIFLHIIFSFFSFFLNWIKEHLMSS